MSSNLSKFLFPPPAHPSFPHPCIIKQGQQPKVGFVSKEVAASISFLLDTVRPRTTSAASDRGDGDVTKTDLVSIGIAHLRSYEHMGQASLTCSGCKCYGDMMLEGMQVRKVSQRHIHSIKATQV